MPQTMSIPKEWKEQGYSQYLFNRNYDSPLIQFFSENKDEEILKSMLDTVFKPKINLNFDNPRDVGDMMSYLEFNSLISLTNTGMSISLIAFFLHKLFDTILKELADGVFGGIIGYHRLQMLLKGGIVYQFYTNGEKGEELVKILHSDNEKGDETVLYFWELLVSQYLEFTSLNSLFVDQYLTQTEILKNFVEGRNIDKEKITKFINKTLQNKKKSNISYKFSNEGVNLAKKMIKKSCIIQGFREFRIREIPVKTIPSQEMMLYIDIVNALFFDEELFLYYSPSTFDIGICDKNHINIHNNTYIFLSFSNIVRALFCENCIGKGVKEIKSRIGEDTWNNAIATKELLKKFSERLISIHPDNFTLNVEGIVHDTNRFSEIKSKNPYGYTSMNGEGYSEKHVRFNNKHELSKFKKSVNKRQKKNDINE